MMKIHKKTKIDTFSSEKLGVFDGLMLQYYAKKRKKIPKDIEKNHIFSGLGTKRWLDYYTTQDPESYNFVGAEFDSYNPYRYDKKIMEGIFSKDFVDSITDPMEGGGDISTVTKNDISAKESFDCIKDFYGNREKYWKKNIKKILEKYGTLFIVGYHLNKKDPIGKMIQKMYGEKCLFIGSCSYSISTQILIIENKYSKVHHFNEAIHNGDYEQIVLPVDKWAPVTEFERKREGNISLVKVTKKNQDKKIRLVGCYLAMTRKEYESCKKISQVYFSLDHFDYVLFFRKSQYMENMFL